MFKRLIKHRTIGFCFILNIFPISIENSKFSFDREQFKILRLSLFESVKY